MATVYGLKTCDTCRKARNWLQRFAIDHDFVDLRERLPEPETFSTWQQAVGGWDKLVNKSSTTWRQLPEYRKAPGSDAEWRLLLREHPALVKRPLLVLDDGRIAQGFSDNAYKDLFGKR
ncbi:MAG: Spx/MgsR family RNA polymerase-binding regulatory protein [Pseudoxanthomonas suwonensis]|nr:Spx/MgsR family RNA polymerase-binding regulatory protein [Pseudoxanthomonas suwonensis]